MMDRSSSFLALLGLFGALPACGDSEESRYSTQCVRGDVGTWSAIPPAPAGGGIAPVVAWTGDEMIVWGGDGRGPDCSGTCTGGARFDPASEEWTILPKGGYEYGYFNINSWLGDRLIVLGGTRAPHWSGVKDDGAIYVPSTDEWQAVQLPEPRWGAVATWTGEELVIVGGSDVDGRGSRQGSRPAFAYNPLRETWTTISNPGFSPWNLNSTGAMLLAWGGLDVPPSGEGSIGVQRGAVYDLSSDEWRPMSQQGMPSRRIYNSAVWTGNELIIWGGEDDDRRPLRDGAAYNPDTDSWRPLSLKGAPSARSGHTALWTGEEMLIHGGEYGCFSVGLYNPETDTWRATTPSPFPRYSAPAVWTGDELLVYGGSLDDHLRVILTDGARLRLE